MDEDSGIVWYHDADGDGYTNNSDTQEACTDPDGTGAGWVSSNTAHDCADALGSDPACNNLDGASCNPGLAGSDGCDGADNDCDGTIDEDRDCDKRDSCGGCAAQQAPLGAVAAGMLCCLIARRGRRRVEVLSGDAPDDKSYAANSCS